MDEHSPSHLVGANPAPPGPHEGGVGQQGHRVEGARGEVGSHRAHDDKQHGLTGPGHTQGGLTHTGEEERDGGGRERQGEEEE